MKGQKVLKITSILMIIGGIIAAIAGVIAILGVSALAALSGSAEQRPGSPVGERGGHRFALCKFHYRNGSVHHPVYRRHQGPWRMQRAGESCFLHQVGHYHCGFEHCLHDHRPHWRRGIQHYQPGSQFAVAGIVCLWRPADERQRQRLIKF